jgi:hypothetical protein
VVGLRRGAFLRCHCCSGRSRSRGVTCVGDPAGPGGGGDGPIVLLGDGSGGRGGVPVRCTLAAR